MLVAIEPLKQSPFIFVTPSGITILFKLNNAKQSSVPSFDNNNPFSNLKFSFLGSITIFFILLSRQKAPPLINATFAGICIFSRFEHPSKAYPPILSTFSGISILFKFVQYATT